MGTINEQTIRILKIFGKSDNGSMLRVTEKSLLIYYLFLNKKLIFPILAMYDGSNITITNLYPVVGLEDIDLHYGLLCEITRGKERLQVSLAEVDANIKKSNQQFIDDYQVWFWENR